MKYKVVPLKDPLLGGQPSFIKFGIVWIESSFGGTTRAKAEPKTYVIRHKDELKKKLIKKGHSTKRLKFKKILF